MPDEPRPTRAELNRKFRAGEIDKKTYNRQKLVVMENARHKKNTAAPSEAADVRYGELWRLGNSGGVAFIVYLITIAIMLGVAIATHTGVVTADTSSTEGSGDTRLDLLLIYAIPSLPAFLLGIIGAVSRLGRAWAVITVVLSVIASPTFVVMGIIGNPTWTLISLF